MEQSLRDFMAKEKQDRLHSSNSFKSSDKTLSASEEEMRWIWWTLFIGSAICVLIYYIIVYFSIYDRDEDEMAF